MEFDDIRQFESDTSQGKILVRIMDLENGTLVLISGSEKFRLGLSAVAIPPGQGRTEPTSTGLFSAGLDAALVRTLAERVAAWVNKSCMIVVAVNTLNQAFLMELMTILKNHFLT
ncbi:MAG: hypothetical protein ACXADC_03010 [Candidatus Thorarchaeota archaeon]|jgi:hypothetical protein